MPKWVDQNRRTCVAQWKGKFIGGEAPNVGVNLCRPIQSDTQLAGGLRQFAAKIQRTRGNHAKIDHKPCGTSASQTSWASSPCWCSLSDSATAFPLPGKLSPASPSPVNGKRIPNYRIREECIREYGEKEDRMGSASVA